MLFTCNDQRGNALVCMSRASLVIAEATVSFLNPRTNPPVFCKKIPIRIQNVLFQGGYWRENEDITAPLSNRRIAEADETGPDHHSVLL